jgi:ABC-2 type transport system permease protein
MIPVSAGAAYFIFGFNLLDLGLALAAFFVLLVLTSWSLGLLSAGVILRYGLGAEETCLVARFHPVAALSASTTRCPVLPDWLKPNCACAIHRRTVLRGHAARSCSTA